jgi:hypothetical protein
MFPVEAFQRTIERFVSIAHQLEIPFHITGGSIGSAYGEPRLIQDIDIVVLPEIAEQRLDDFFSAIRKSDFLYAEQVMRQGVLKSERFQLLDTKESLKLDQLNHVFVNRE